MPLYDYHCEVCGPFREWRGMSEATKPLRCSGCGRSAQRQISAPHVRTGQAGIRYKAEALNEKSAHEPRVVQHVGRKNADKEVQGHAQHSHHGKHGHLHRSNRPWMVGH